MQRSLERFQISPEDYFAGVDRAFEEMRSGIGALARRADDLSALCEELALVRLAGPAAAPPPSRWTYDVRLPNHLFADLFDAEEIAGGAKRWVGTGCRLGVTLRMPRNVQYDLAIQIEDFVSETAAKSFFLRIDGVQYPWLSHEGKRYTSLVLIDEAAETLGIEIGVDPSSLPDGRDVSFSFRSIDVARRQ
jgi:hypothetical protein